MINDKTSYRDVVKSTAIFGGVQVFTIIISIIRSKVIALLVGPFGMGFAGLLNSTTSFISLLTGFSLEKAAVRDVAEAYGKGDEDKIGKVITVFRRLIWFTGILGTIVIIVLSPWLSKITFGNNKYTNAFVLVSFTLLITQVTNGQNVILQGMRRVKYLANSTILGSLFGLIITLPLYYFWGVDGIVPSIIINSIVILIISLYYARKIKIKSQSKKKIGLRETIVESKIMLKMGYAVNLGNLITMLGSYLLRIFIRNIGGVEEVGLYNAGMTIIGSYVGMFFTVMTKDYYPRLAGCSYSNRLCNQLINQYTEMGVLLLTPIVLIFIVYIKFIITMLYSNEFIYITNMLQWAMLGFLLRAVCWFMGYLLLAKKAATLFFFNELLGGIYSLGLNILGYFYLGGLTGLGISFLFIYLLGSLQVFIISKIKYGFYFSKEFYKVFTIGLLLAFGCLITIKTIKGNYSYILGNIFFIGSSILISYKELDKRLDIKAVLSGIRSKYLNGKK